MELRACREKIIMMSEEGFDLRKKNHSASTVSIGRAVESVVQPAKILAAASPLTMTPPNA